MAAETHKATVAFLCAADGLVEATLRRVRHVFYGAGLYNAYVCPSCGGLLGVPHDAVIGAIDGR